ncbi:MAG TPA: malonate decarboxylase acyl carrier protein [Casimicrobiaceae bacterium]|jgi:malonate decarboxylase delta subunit
MEHLSYRSPGKRRMPQARPTLVGVVASGNLEVLIEPASLRGDCTVDVATPVSGFERVWAAVVGDFLRRHDLADVRVYVNDNGATPAIVALRLDQAVEEYARSGGATT